MKFEFYYGAGLDRTTATFTGHLYRLPQSACLEILTSFEKIGGKVDNDNSCIFHFPSFITSQVIEEVIRNTCFVCGGLMGDGQAIQNSKIIIESYDSAIDTYEGRIEYPDTNNYSTIKVRKCSTCGHSHT